MISQETLTLLFKATGDTEHAKKAFSELEKSIEKDISSAEKDVKNLDGAGKGLDSTLGKVAGAGAIVGTALVTMATGAAIAARAAFELSKNFSTLGVEIGTTKDKTGLSAEALSSLKVAAEESGVSFSALSGNIEGFSKLLTEAANGSDSAKAKLERLGIDPVKGVNDLDGALRKALDRIVSLENPVERAAAATDAFGESGRNLIPMLVKYDGNLDKIIESARKFGLVVSNEDVQASKEFHDALNEVNRSLQGVYLTIGKELLPIVKDLASEFSSFTVENQKEIREWGETLAVTIGNAVKGFKILTKFVEDNEFWFRLALGVATAGQSEAIGAALKPLADRIEQQRLQRASGGLAYGQAPGAYNTDTKEREKAAKKRQRDAEKRRQEAKRSFEKELRDQAEHIRISIKADEDLYSRQIQDLEDRLQRKEITSKEFRDRSLIETKAFASSIETLLTEAADIDLTNKKGTERANAIAKAGAAEIAFRERIGTAKRDIEKTITEFEQKELDTRVKNQEQASRTTLTVLEAQNDKWLASLRLRLEQGDAKEREYVRERQKADVAMLESSRKQLLAERDLHEKNSSEYKRIQAEIDVLDTQIITKQIEHKIELLQLEKRLADQRQKELEDLEEKNRLLKEQADREYERQLKEAEEAERKLQAEKDNSNFSSIFGSDVFTDLEGNVLSTTQVVGAALTEMGDIAKDVFRGMKEAVGESIANWVLYGGSIGKALKQALAAQLAHVAAMATLKALESTAWGFYHLATFNFPAAANAFISAGLWGGLAAGTALAGRAIAGNSFQRESQGGFGSSSSQFNNSGSSGSSGPNVLAENRVQRQEITLNIRSNDSHITEVVKGNIEDRGELHGTIIKFAEQT